MKENPILGFALSAPSAISAYRYAAVGKEPFYRKLGFKRMATAMAIFQNQAQAVANGLLIEEG